MLPDLAKGVQPGNVVPGTINLVILDHVPTIMDIACNSKQHESQ